MARAVLIRRLVWTLACASLAFGVWRSVQPDALVDVHRVIEWTRVPLGGACPYTLAQETAPHRVEARAPCLREGLVVTS